MRSHCLSTVSGTWGTQQVPGYLLGLPERIFVVELPGWLGRPGPLENLLQDDESPAGCQAGGWSTAGPGHVRRGRRHVMGPHGVSGEGKMKGLRGGYSWGIPPKRFSQRPGPRGACFLTLAQAWGTRGGSLPVSPCVH